jgi:hypothetical protein
MGITSAVIAAVGVATALASTGYALSKGGPDLPPAPPPPAAPPPPKPAPPLPTPPIEADAEQGVGQERRKRAQRFGVESTLLASPLGGGSDLPGRGGTGKSLLGG